DEADAVAQAEAVPLGVAVEGEGALDEFHREPGEPLPGDGIEVQPALVDGGDAGVAEAGEGLGLVGEAAFGGAGGRAGSQTRGGPRGEPAAQELEGDGASGLLLLGLVDDAHAAGADLADQAVASDASGEAAPVVDPRVGGVPEARGRTRGEVLEVVAEGLGHALCVLDPHPVPDSSVEHATLGAARPHRGFGSWTGTRACGTGVSPARGS